MKIIRLSEIARVAASHEDPADPGVLKQIFLKRDDLAPGRIQMVNWATLLSGKSFRAHQHEDMDEIFIILNGKVEITIGNERETLEKGDAVVIPEDTIHVMKNLTDRDICYIAIGISRGEDGKTIVV